MRRYYCCLLEYIAAINGDRQFINRMLHATGPLFTVNGMSPSRAWVLVKQLDLGRIKSGRPHTIILEGSLVDRRSPSVSRVRPQKHLGYNSLCSAAIIWDFQLRSEDAQCV